MKRNSRGRRPNVRTGYAHEFILFRPARTGGQAHMSRTDALLIASPTQQRGAIGAKPGRWTQWVLDCVGYESALDVVTDMLPGSGAVTRAVEEYRQGCERCGQFIPASRGGMHGSAPAPVGMRPTGAGPDEGREGCGRPGFIHRGRPSAQRIWSAQAMSCTLRKFRARGDLPTAGTFSRA